MDTIIGIMTIIVAGVVVGETTITILINGMDRPYRLGVDMTITIAMITMTIGVGTMTGTATIAVVAEGAEVGVHEGGEAVRMIDDRAVLVLENGRGGIAMTSVDMIARTLSLDNYPYHRRKRKIRANNLENVHVIIAIIVKNTDNVMEMQGQSVVKGKARVIPRREKAEKDVTIKIGVEVRRIVIEMKRIVTTIGIENGIAREVVAGVATESAGTSAESAAVVNMIVGEK